MPPSRSLLVASTGGHLEELYRIARRLHPSVSERDWVSFDDPQTDSLLAGERVFHVKYVPPRGIAAALANLSTAALLVRSRRYGRVISTGAGVALPFMLVARLRRIPCHYFESAARTEHPSVTGHIVSRLPGVALYSQYPSWADKRWVYRGSLFDEFEVSPSDAGMPPSRDVQARSVVVTLGTMRTYGYRRAVERLRVVLPEVTTPDAKVLWQVGATDTRGLDIQALDRVSAVQLREAMAEADLVVAHAGIGSALNALEHGRCPVLLPRRRRYSEHVDDHQLMIADELASRGLAMAVDASALTADHLRTAMATLVRRRDTPAPIFLQDEH